MTFLISPEKEEYKKNAVIEEAIIIDYKVHDQNDCRLIDE